MNSIDHETYSLAKYHFVEMRDLTLAYAVESLKTVEMKSKNTNAAEKSVHRSKREQFQDEKTCYYCKKPGHIKIFCYSWLDYTEENRRYAKEHPREDREPTEDSKY